MNLSRTSSVTEALTRNTTINLKTLSLNAPWNWTTNKLQKLRRQGVGDVSVEGVALIFGLAKCVVAV